MATITLKEIDSLKKSELMFELKSCGTAAKQDMIVLKLRSMLRSLLNQNINPDFRNIVSLDIDLATEVSEAEKSLTTLVDDIENLVPDGDLKFDRIGVRLRIFKARLNILLMWLDDVTVMSGDEPSQLKTKLEILRSTISNADSICNDLRLNTQVAPCATEDGTSDDVNRHFGVGVNTPVNESVVPVGNLVDFSNLNPSNQNLVCSASNTCQSNFNSIYAKLNHPAEKLISSIPICDGFNVNNLLNFFRISLQLINSYSDVKNNIMTVLIPFTTGQLNSILLKHNCFNDFHKEALVSLIPTRQLNTLTQELFYRPQRLKEPLNSYITEIKQIALVLRLALSELEIINVILEGLSPDVRSCLAFTNRPVDFNELDKMCVQVSNTFYTDRQRINSDSVARVYNNSTSKKNQLTSKVICHFCRQPGHIRPQCESYKRSLNRNDKDSKN